MVRAVAHHPRSRDNTSDAEELAEKMRIWYCILPAHFGPIPDDKAKECLEKECIHLCFDDVPKIEEVEDKHRQELNNY